MRSACHYAEAYASATGHPASPPEARATCEGALLSVYVRVARAAPQEFGFFRLCTRHAEQLKALGRLRHAALLRDVAVEAGGV